MKQIAFLFFLFLFVSCSQQETNQVAEAEPKTKNNQPFQTIKHGTLGIILTNELTVYDLNMSVLKKVGDLYGEVVEIDSISKNKYDLKNTDDRCNLYNFVKVRSKKINGWVYSPEVFEQQIASSPMNKSPEDTLFHFKSIQIKLIPTKNFNIGVYDEKEDMLSFCDGNQNPVILYNSVYDKYEYIPLSNETSKEINYPIKYFTFDSHDGWHDELISSSFSNKILTLKLKREFQEGHAKIVIQILLDPNQSRGKIISFEHDPYSYD